MRVLILMTVACPEYAYSQGQTVDVPADEAILLVRHGAAKALDEAEYYKAVDAQRRADSSNTGEVGDAPRTAEAQQKGRKATRKNK